MQEMTLDRLRKMTEVLFRNTTTQIQIYTTSKRIEEEQKADQEETKHANKEKRTPW